MAKNQYLDTILNSFKVHLKNAILSSFFCFFLCICSWAQTEMAEALPRNLKEVGHPFVQNYGPSEYNAFDQNWGFAQDSLGMLYVANGDGVLTYDGVNWQLLELPNKGAVLSIASDRESSVYVGAHNELGFLEADSLGRLQYTSLLPYLKKEYHDFNLIRQLYSTEKGIYFRGDGILLRWKDNRFKVWKTENGASLSAFPAAEKMYVWYAGKGLTVLNDKGFELLPAGEMLAGTRVRAVLPVGEKLLVATNDDLFVYDGTVFTVLKTDYPSFFNENYISTVIALSNDTFAIASNNKGILVIDSQGRRRTMISGDDVLRSNQVFNLFQDHQGLLWAGLQSGIAKIEYPSSFSLYDKVNALSHSVIKVQRFRDKLYIGTSAGLYTLAPDHPTDHQAIADPQITGFTFDLMTHGNDLLVGSNGVYVIGEDATERISGEGVFCLVRSKLNPNRVFVGHNSGLFTIYQNNGAWIKEKIFDDIAFTVHNIVEMANGNLWLRTNANTIARIAFKSTENATKLQHPLLKIFDSEHGFPNDVGRPMLLENKLYFIASNGDAHVFDAEEQRFQPDSQLYTKLGFIDVDAEINVVDHFGNVWVTTENEEEKLDSFLALLQADGSYRVKSLNESRIVNYKRGAPYFEASDSVAWYNSKTGGIIRHDLRENLSTFKPRPNSRISAVFYGGDSSLYGGFGNAKHLAIPYAKNLFRFKFASPSFLDEKRNRFQYYLEGYDDRWSDWFFETQKDYTNIPEGDYTFKVRSKNMYGQISAEDSYSFTILSPWYRTWWAYLTYAFGAVMMLWYVVQWRSRQLRNKNLALEALVSERTEEIRHKNKLLGHQTERLKEMDTMKTRLFANISHEFRTPLTLIKGPIEKLESLGENTITTANIKMIRRNANRLLNLVNQLLDLSKLDSGKLKLNEAEGDVFKCIRAAASAFSSHAASRQMDYQIKIPSRLLWAEFDRDKLEKVMYNLLSNAFKFTEDEGRIVIETEFRNSRLKIKISDTGVGISSEKLPHIFDRFYQVDDSYTKEKSGSGIGLALTKELVELMGGTIYVESEEFRGTSFRVVVPLEEIKSNHIQEPEDNAVVPNMENLKYTPTETERNNEVKVLIIEDNNDMRHYIKEQLQQQYMVIEAVHGKDGLKQANKVRPDLIITDLMMPKIDGITLCKKLKTTLATSHIPVIMLTAKAGLENKLEGLETGADEYLTKPFNAKELQIRVKNLIEQRQKLRELFSKNISLNPKEISVTSLDEDFMNHLLALLEEKHADSEFGVPQMQKALAMSKTSLHSKVKALTNHPPGELLRIFRLKRAAQLLSQKGDNVSQVAYDVGFNSLSYFTRCFKKYFKVAPSAYKNE